MRVIVIRHALSEANNRENIGTPAFGNPDAGLMDTGREQAKALSRELHEQYAITFGSIAVATSTLRRTQETAQLSGFSDIKPQALLDEIEPVNLVGTELRQMLDANKLPAEAITGAMQTLENPPRERIWFSHGLRIAGLCAVLGEYQQEERLVPRFCEIRELNI